MKYELHLEWKTLHSPIPGRETFHQKSTLRRFLHDIQTMLIELMWNTHFILTKEQNRKQINISNHKNTTWRYYWIIRKIHKFINKMHFWLGHLQTRLSASAEIGWKQATIVAKITTKLIIRDMINTRMLRYDWLADKLTGDLLYTRTPPQMRILDSCSDFVLPV